MKVDFFRHGLDRDDAATVADVLASPFLTTGGVCKAVEEQLCAYFGTPHALLTSSWTSGATAVLMALAIGPGDEVIVPAMTFIASANVVEMTGARTVLVDVDPATLLVTPEAMAAAVTARTRAVIPVHLYGQMVDIAALRAALDAVSGPGQRIAIIEDCAHCFEGKLRGERPGRHSDVAIFSFYATKNVTCGEGGGIVFNSTPLFETTRETRLHGMSAIAADRFKGGTYNHWGMQRLGIKANLPDLLAALLPKQIANIDSLLTVRTDVAMRYEKAFAGSPLRLPIGVPGGTHAWHLYVIGVPGGRRDQAIARLNGAGIAVTVNYRALPELAYYSARYPDAAARSPAAMTWGRETISLPLYPGMPADQQQHVIDIVLGEVVPLVDPVMA